MFTHNFPIIESQTKSSSFSTSAFEISRVLHYSIQIVYGTGLVGTFKLQESNDGANWADVASGDLTINGSTASNKIFNVRDCCTRFVRIDFAIDGATSGTVSAIIATKAIS
jgi:hypothetical protein